MMNTTQEEVEMNPESEAKRKKKVLKKKIKSSSNPVGDSEYIEYRRSGSSERHQSPPVYYPPPPPNYQMPYYPHPSSPFGYYPPPSGVPYDYNRGYVPPTQSSSSSADDYIYDQNSGKFYFKPRRETLNWRVLLQLDVEKIMDQVDIDTLESVTKNVTFSRIDYNDLRYFNETNFVQVFRISQLIIEYLLYVQNYLSTKKKEVESNVKTIIQDLEDAKLNLVKKTEEVAYLKKELKRKKKALYAYECVFGTNPEKARILLMSQSNQNQPVTQMQPTQPQQQTYSRSDREETFGELRGDIKRLQETLFSQLESTIEKKQSQLEKENQKKLDYFQNEFERFTESFKKQQENLYSTIAKSVSKFAESDASTNSEGNRDEFLQFSSQIQNLIQQNNQQILTSFERKLNDLSASTKQVKKADQDEEILELKKKLDTVLNALQNKQMEQVKPVDVVVNKMSRVEPTPAQEETIVVKAKPKHAIVKKEEPVVAVVVKSKEEPPKKEPMKMDIIKPKEPKKEPMKEPMKEPIKVLSVETTRDSPKERPKSIRSTSPPTKQVTVAETNSKSVVTIVEQQPKPAVSESQPVVSPPKPIEEPKQQVPPPAVQDVSEEEEHDQSYTTTNSEIMSEAINTTTTSVETDVSTLGLKERIYRDIELGKVFEEFGEGVAYQHEEDKPWLTSKFKQNSLFREIQKTETKALVEHEMNLRGIDMDQHGLSEAEYSRGLKSLQKERDSVVKNNPDHLVIMNELREKVDNIVAESNKNVHPQVAFSQYIDDIINKIQKMNDFDEEKRKLPLTTPKTPQSPVPVGAKNNEDDEKETPTVKIPPKPAHREKSEPAMKLVAATLMQEALLKKKEMDENKKELTTTLFNTQKPQSAKLEEQRTRVDQQTTLKSMDFTKKVNEQDEEEDEQKSVNNTKIIEAEFEDEMVEEDHETTGSTLYEEVGHGDEDDSQYTYEYETATEQDPNETKRGDISVQEESFVENSKNKDTVQAFTAIDEDSEISEKNHSKQQPSKSVSNLKKPTEESSSVMKVVSKVSKLKAHSSDEEDSDDNVDLPISKGGSTLTNAALGNKFKSLNNMWEDMNKKKSSTLDDSLDLPGSDDFDLSSFKPKNVPSSKQTKPSGSSMLSSDVSGFIKTLKEEDDDLDTEEL